MFFDQRDDEIIDRFDTFFFFLVVETENNGVKIIRYRGNGNIELLQ